MWITALFGMATKYAEAILAVKYRVSNENGEYSGEPMYYLERGLGKKWLAILFAIFGTTAFSVLVIWCNLTQLQRQCELISLSLLL